MTPAAVLPLVAVAFQQRTFPPQLMCSGRESFTSVLPALPESVAQALEARGLHTPTPIQRVALPRVHTGESLLLHAETGSGKSLAFLLPALTRLGLAGLSDAVPAPLADQKVLVVAPTRELAVQLANEASLVVPAPGAVQIIAIGAIPAADALLHASIVACTAPELLALLNSEGGGRVSGVVDAVLSQVRVLVLDELDMLLPVSSTYGARAAQRKRSDARTKRRAPAEELVKVVMEASSMADLQLLAASATVSRPTRLKLARVLRQDPLGRWYDQPPEIVRTANAEDVEHGAELSRLPRAVVIPPSIRHFYVPLPASLKLRRAMPAVAARPSSARRLTLKQKRAAKLAAQKAARTTPSESDIIHPLLEYLSRAVRAIEPQSALVFLCRSSGLTVRRAARDLRRIGIDAVPLHEAIGLEHAPTSFEAGGGSMSETHETDGPRQLRRHRPDADAEGEVDTSGALQQRHRAVSAAFTSRMRVTHKSGEGGGEGSGEGEGRDGGASGAPLLITFEDMARGLHFDAVDAVFILGMPDSPATYLHLAGRTGRQPVLEGNVITLCPGRANEQLMGWAPRLGGIHFQQLHLPSQEAHTLAAAARTES